MSHEPTKQAAVFLDRDGVLNVYLPGDYVAEPEQLELLPGTVPGVKTINALGLPAFVISNQQGVAKGVMSQADLDRVDARLYEQLHAGGATVVRSYYCPHHKDDRCDCRKPRAGLLLRAAREHNLDLSGSFFVGDTDTDAKAARAAGVRAFILVLSGKIKSADAAQDSALFITPPDYVATDLAEAAAWIADQVSRRP